ncbi:MAG: ATP-binding protein [Clostridia bacterium]|nr:ATP-binding protein [Deltaproteobacteria bacterium]
MLHRRITTALEQALARAPAVVLLGPRQVGKTTLARTAAEARPDAIYLDLERPTDLRRLTADPEAFLRGNERRLIVIDEIHRAPALFPVLRGVIDERRRSNDSAGHFLLLGSAALDLMNQASESLAGRVSYLELAPFDALEVSRADLETLWTRGGFAESFLARDDRHSFRWRTDFLRSYLERDVPMFAPRLPSETVRRLWTMLAHGQGSLLDQARLASSLGVSSPAVARYIDLLVDLLLVRRLRPWSGNVGKRLVRSPKVYVRDSGITHALLELRSRNDVLGHPVAGLSWEGFVIENLVQAGGDARTPYFYRTADGAEVDLVFERGGTVEMAIEIKRSSTPELSRGFHSARVALKPSAAYVVHAGADTWTCGDGIVAIPLPALMERLAATA